MSLQLGPIVGHTDHESTRIWIRVSDDASLYALRVKGNLAVPFQSTESGAIEFGTALAIANGLRPDWRYRYQILRRGRVVFGASGSFRTMPLPGSMADILFIAVSCNHQEDQNEDEGAWPQVAAFIEKADPRFLILIGDQIYMDQGRNLWAEHLASEPAVRRTAMAEKYQQNWSRETLSGLLANIPTYMMWDDHDIRDGWGSWAPDSPTLAEKYPDGADIFERHNAYFEDTRDVCWHFQMCHNPGVEPSQQTFLPNYVTQAPSPGERRAMPFVFRCGRMIVLMLDGRGDRDLWRPNTPVLGSEQWQFIRKVFKNLPPDIDALAVVTPVPIASMSPTGQVQFLVGQRTDDVELFKKGDAKGLNELMSAGDKDVVNLAGAAAGGWLSSRFGISANLGSFKAGDIDDARDQWSNHISRPEQEALLREAGEARLSNRVASIPRGLIFVGGDIHSGGILTF